MQQRDRLRGRGEALGSVVEANGRHEAADFYIKTGFLRRQGSVVINPAGVERAGEAGK